MTFQVNGLARGSRQQCPHCLRALCICHLVQQQVSSTRLLIWQHPNEVHHVKGSGRLLHLCLPDSVIISAEHLRLQQVLEFAQLESSDELALLYPNDDLAGAFASSQIADCSKLKTLVLLDASWRDSRKLLRLNPYLLDLPRYALQHSYAPRYRIRKAHKAGQLSSMEAGIYALSEINKTRRSDRVLADSPFNAAALLSVFDAFVDKQAAYFLP